MHPAKQNRAEYHIRVPRDLRQNLGKGLMAKTRRAHSKSPCPLPHSPSKSRVEIEPRFRNAGTIALNIQKTERRRRFAHVC